MKETIKEQAYKELAKRELEKRHAEKRESLKSFLFSYWKDEKKQELDDNWHIDLICNKLEKVFNGEIKRLIIEVPPRSLKTETVSVAFPAWCMGKRPTKFISVSYSGDLAKKSSMACRSTYTSETFSTYFPRRAEISDSQAEKTNWETQDGSQYYSAGSSGTITGVGCDIMIIDDPLKPTDAKSDTVRNSVNNNFFDTLKSRLNDKENGAIIIIMQRLHEDDLVGRLKEKMMDETGENWDIVTIKAIAEEDEEFRKKGESFFVKRFPLAILNALAKEDEDVFRTQYQQSPGASGGNEFFREWFRYYDAETHFPAGGRTFTTVDPAFKDKETNDYTAITTSKVIGDQIYIIEQTVARMQTPESIDKILEHIRKWQPEICAIEDKGGQIAFINAVRQQTQLERLFKTEILDLKQAGSKETKIRPLTHYYRNGYIFHPTTMDSRKMTFQEKQASLEEQLLAFPLGKHDDAPDSLAMLLSLIELKAPGTVKQYKIPKITYDRYGRPKIS